MDSFIENFFINSVYSFVISFIIVVIMLTFILISIIRRNGWKWLVDQIKEIKKDMEDSSNKKPIHTESLKEKWEANNKKTEK